MPQWEYYRIQRRDANIWLFFGNEKVELKAEGEKGEGEGG